ncbi:MAG: hypothetical protein NTV68_16035, partial [Methanomicrobiales archaeon]|nr:hypothetical protein [Methanomicrobiales archaeon]
RRGQNRCRYLPKPEVPRKGGSAKIGLARGYQLTFAMTGLGWGGAMWGWNSKGVNGSKYLKKSCEQVVPLIRFSAAPGGNPF